jgi:hypothetical protein
MNYDCNLYLCRSQYNILNYAYNFKHSNQEAHHSRNDAAVHTISCISIPANLPYKKHVITYRRQVDLPNNGVNHTWKSEWWMTADRQLSGLFVFIAPKLHAKWMKCEWVPCTRNAAHTVAVHLSENKIAWPTVAKWLSYTASDQAKSFGCQKFN